MRDYLHRDDAPFGDVVWQQIDRAVVSVARSRLSGRRLLQVEGPSGLELSSLNRGDECVSEEQEGRPAIRAMRVMPVPEISRGFTLSVRSIAAMERAGQAVDLAPAVGAAAACAALEDEIIFNGHEQLGLAGLMSAKGVQRVSLASWDDVTAAVPNLLDALARLDGAGFTGPFGLALAPALYNGLFRLYPQGLQSGMDHLRQVIPADNIVKSSALARGGVLVTAIPELAAIVVGQDLATSFVGPSGRDYEFSVSESVALRLTEPRSVCVIQ